MLEYFRKILRVLKIKKEAERQGQAQAAPAPRDFDASLDQNLAFFRQRLGDSSDIVIKEFQIDGAGGPRCALLLIDGL
ncbi:MAG TPA: hypothetical protein PK438_07585, partial [Clostridia bacterium]|nr:hypothetical protein [Clostridia bacterium]